MSGRESEHLADKARRAFERFAASGAPQDRDMWIDAGTRALERMPDHPDADDWRYLLVPAYRSRALDSGAAADWHAALLLAEDLRRRVAYDVELATEVDAERALTLFLRFDSCPQRSEDELRRANHVLVRQLHELLPSDGQSMILGLALLDRFTLDGDPLIRSSGLERLGAALPELADDDPLVPEALGFFAKALDVARLDDVDPEQAARWRDTAIDAVARARTVFTPQERPDLVLLDGELRCSRGDMTDDLDDLRAGLTQLELFEQTADPGDPELAFAALQQAMARVRIWHLTDDPADRLPIVDCCDRALIAGLPDDLVLDAHRRALDVVCAHLDAEPSAAGSAAARFDIALAALVARPDGDPGYRAELAMALAGLSCQLVGTHLDPERLAALLAIARGHPDPHSEWDTLLNLMTALHTFLIGVLAGNLDFDVLSEVVAVWRRTGHVRPLAGRMAAVLGVLACFDAAQTGDLARLQVARAFLEQRSGTDDGLDVVRVLVRGIEAHRHARTDGERVDAGRQMAAALEAGSTDGWSRDHMLPFARALTAMFAGAAPSSAPASPGADPLGRLLGDLTAAMTTTAALVGAARRPGELRRMLAETEAGLAQFPSGSPARLAAVLALATGSLHLARSAPGDRAAAESAVRWNSGAVDLLGGPQHPLWAQHSAGLAAAYRLRRDPGDLAGSRCAGLAALRGHAWQVLLQTGTEHSLVAARSAAALAAEVAGWCTDDRAVDDKATDDLVRAVEAGRGLALHAATTTRGVARTLAALGDHDLAVEWAAAGGVDRQPLPADSGFEADVRGHLRRRVLHALQAADPAVLDPPDPSTIAAAVRRSSGDALVYLVPGPDGGWAVSVLATGAVEVLDLPGLGDGAAGPLARCAAAYQHTHGAGVTRDMAPAPSVPADWSGALDELLRWAWDAAAGPLLTAGHRWCAGREPRLVLVPVGPLGLVPWHAAVRDQDGVARHLVQDAVISYAASGRLLVELAARAPVADGDVVLIGDPTGDLPSAGVEAEAVRAAFHPDATYLGTVTGQAGRHGRGTAAELLERFTAPARPCSVLHLACHARAEPADPERSCLVLAGGELLQIQDLLDRSPTVSLPLDAVLLAACSTTVSGLDHDEAFSLATAFLAAGARSVVASLWPVPDASTAHLMFMIHHFRTVDGSSMADALRQAQLWMLDPGRTLQSTFPRDLAASGAADEQAYRDPVAWAAFTHQGR